MFQFSFIAGITLLALTATANNQSCLPIYRDCSFYSRCLEAAVPCGPNGYAIGTGLPYCLKFEEHYERFSLRGREWVWTTAYCLQTALIPVANREKTMTCGEIHSFAFASHSGCYTQLLHLRLAIQWLVVVVRNDFARIEWSCYMATNGRSVTYLYEQFTG